MNYIKKRSGEPSTWAGLSALIFGTMSILQIEGGQQIAEAVATTGAGVIEAGATSESLIMGGVGLFAAILGMFVSEDKK